MSIKMKFCAGAVTLVIGAGSAIAGGYTPPLADTPVAAPVALPDAAVNWSGGYAGLSAGYIFGGDDKVGISDPDDDLVGAPGSTDIKGASYGLHVGYRWQREMRGRQIVYGPELSYEGSSADAGFSANGVNASSELSNLIALRFKTGVLNAAQDTLFYGSVGAMRGEFDYVVDGAGMDYDDSFKENAWTVGLGVERRITDRVSVFGEWEYRGFGKTTLTDSAGYHTEATPEHHAVKLGVNFNF